MPQVYVDITSVIEGEMKAMAAMAAQVYLREYYGQRAEQRANHARKVTGNAEIRYAEFGEFVQNVLTERAHSASTTFGTIRWNASAYLISAFPVTLRAWLARCSARWP